MKKRVLVIYTVLIGSFFMVGCSTNQKDPNINNKTQNGTSKGDTEKNDSSRNSKPDSKDDALSKGELTEDDVVSKTKENYNGEEYIKYELKDGSTIITKEGDDDLDKINEAIQKENGNQSKKVD